MWLLLSQLVCQDPLIMQLFFRISLADFLRLFYDTAQLLPTLQKLFLWRREQVVSDLILIVFR